MKIAWAIRSIPNPWRIRLMGLAFLLAMPSNAICFLNHLCMAGHGAHPPYPWREVYGDYLWFSLFVFCTVGSIRTHAKGVNLFFISCPIFILFRAGGHGLDILIIPLYAACVCYAIAYLFFPRKFDTTIQPHPAAPQKPA